MERQEREQIVFDLVEDEHEIDGADGGRRGSGATPRSGGGRLLRDLGAALVSGMVRARGWVSRHRAVSLIATGVAAAVVLSAAGLGTVRERERIELLRTAPGGVESLAGPPAEEWRYASGRDTNLVNSRTLGVGAVVMGGNVVFLEGRQSGVSRPRPDGGHTLLRWSDADLVALDARSGEEAWRVSLGDDPECTPPEVGGASRVLDEVVCLMGPPDERSVVAVTTDGDVSEARRLDPGDRAEREEVIPAWDGLVVRARSHGQAPEIDCPDHAVLPTECTLPNDDPEWGVTVHAEDARTGDEVWRETAPWSENLSLCPQAVDGADDSGIDQGDFSLVVGGALIQVWGCGVQASFHADGTMIAGDAMLSGSGDLILSHHYTYEDHESVTTVRTTDGDELLTTSGWPAEGGATDGTPSDVFIVATDQGRSLQGYRLDGSRAWERENSAQMVARVGHTGVFRRFDDGRTALDLHSGKVLWEGSGDDAGVHGLSWHSPTFTDGRTVMQVSGPQTPWGEPDHQADEGVHLVAVDAHSGQLRWEVTHDDVHWFAVDGRLLSVALDGSLVGYHQPG